MGNWLWSSSPPVRSSEQVRQFLVELMPAVIADIIELYLARPRVGAFDRLGDNIQIFGGDWVSQRKSILLEPALRARLEVVCVLDVCEFFGSLVFITCTSSGGSTIVADNQGSLHEHTMSSGCFGTLVQLHDKLYSFGRSHFAVFDHHAKCFLPNINLPPGCSGVMKVCVFKGLLYLLRLMNGPTLRLTRFDIDASKYHDEGTFPEVWASQMCANDNSVFVYGLAPDKIWSPWLIVTWNHDTGFTAVERVRGYLRIITCDNVYIYFSAYCNTVLLYDIARKQFTPDAAPIQYAEHMRWFGVSSLKIF